MSLITTWLAFADAANESPAFVIGTKSIETLIVLVVFENVGIGSILPYTASSLKFELQLSLKLVIVP